MKISNSAILSAVLIAALISSMAFAVSPVRDPVLYFKPCRNAPAEGMTTCGGTLARLVDGLKRGASQAKP